MNPQTEAVMARYRGLKAQGLSGLQASHQTRLEFEGHLSPSDVPTGDNVPMTGNLCECGSPNETGRSQCAACRKRAYRERSRHGSGN